jgi:hypothetical protein
MAFKFNPFTGTFDQTGSSGGASYIDGEVAAYANLPLDGTAPLDSAWLVRTASGVWPVSRKQAGIYIRTAMGGTSIDDDWTYAGTMPDVFSDANFTIYDDADSSKTLKFQLSGITTGTPRTLIAPNASGTLALTSTFAAPPAIGNTTAAAGNFTTLGASGTITAATSSTTPPTNITDARGIQWANVGGATNQTGIWSGYAGIPIVGIGIGTNTFGALTEVARFASTGATISGGTVTASAPVLDLSQTWNGTGVTFTGLKLNATNTASATASALVDFQIGGTSYFKVTRGGGTGLDTEWVCGATSIDFSVGGHRQFRAYSSTTQSFYIEANGGLNFTPTNNGSASTNIQAEAAATLAQRQGTTAQTYRIYNTYTDASNFERGFLRWSSNVLQIGTEKLGIGTARALAIQTDGTTRINIGSAGQLGFFGAAAAAQPTAVADATDAASVITQLNALLARMRTLGLLAT